MIVIRFSQVPGDQYVTLRSFTFPSPSRMTCSLAILGQARTCTPPQSMHGCFSGSLPEKISCASFRSSGLTVVHFQSGNGKEKRNEQVV